MRAIVFSKDRALQLDGMLRSLEMHAKDPVEIVVIWQASAIEHEKSYMQLQKMHEDDDDDVMFAHELDFESDVRLYLNSNRYDNVLFLTDDTIFVCDWSPDQCDDALKHHRDAIGFSLRLGKNTTECYPMARSQSKPTRSICVCGAYEHDWITSEYDWGYPIELSSSVYRTDDIIRRIERAHFTGPNMLEVALDASKSMMPMRATLLSYETSVAFSNPCNRVQSVYANRSGEHPSQSAGALLEAWESGYRMRVEAYAGLVPDGAHMLAPICLERRP